MAHNNVVIDIINMKCFINRARLNPTICFDASNRSPCMLSSRPGDSAHFIVCSHAKVEFTNITTTRSVFARCCSADRNFRKYHLRTYCCVSQCFVIRAEKALYYRLRLWNFIKCIVTRKRRKPKVGAFR